MSSILKREDDEAKGDPNLEPLLLDRRKAASQITSKAFSSNFHYLRMKAMSALKLQLKKLKICAFKGQKSLIFVVREKGFRSTKGLS